MKLYKKEDIARAGQRISTFPPHDRRRGTGPDLFDRGVLIFCGISVALAILSLWIAASGHGDLSATMF